MRIRLGWLGVLGARLFGGSITTLIMEVRRMTDAVETLTSEVQAAKAAMVEAKKELVDFKAQIRSLTQALKDAVDQGRSDKIVALANELHEATAGLLAEETVPVEETSGGVPVESTTGGAVTDELPPGEPVQE